ncbi:MAG: magnesium-translocating P-type ATPase [Desulfitobacteriaceae bacterium]|nr:magnesium-translocating P-type ATPase [Desulfitobacteriaceae bacterium]MDI6913610.1 magnesium-translocating P-type ATPase [Desulfitobacteriaceae bacterium]
MMDLSSFWSLSVDQLFEVLNSSPSGLSSEEASHRLELYGANSLKPKWQSGKLALFLQQFKSPIMLILIFAATLSFFLQDKADTLIILGIVLISGSLSFWQELGAADAMQKLLSIVEVRASIVRDGKHEGVPLEKVVPGDIVILAAGDGIPGDCLIIESNGLFIDEAALTGETYPVEKSVGVLAPDIRLAQRTNVVFMGTHVVSGTGQAIVVKTGQATEFGQVAERLRLRAPETEFERGIRQFGYLLMEVTLLLVLAIFAINVFLLRPVLDSFLFSLALAVGLTPQLLPAIISINLARGAKNMAAKKVIVKRLASIENFGSMNVLCSDKTGTLTEGEVHIHSSLSCNGEESEKVLKLSYINSYFQKGYTNPIDEAVRAYRPFDLQGYEKVNEIPYDFIRKRLSVWIREGESSLLITKGAFAKVLEICAFGEGTEQKRISLQEIKDQILAVYSNLANQGLRVLGVAYKEMSEAETQMSEKDMIFSGFLVLFDPAKADIPETISQLKAMGIRLKVISGDSKSVVTSIGKQIGLAQSKVLTGSEMHSLSVPALLGQVNDVDLFAEIEPSQKERIILALKKAGNVVGYLGDGINDAPALHAADVGISVNSAVKVAKDAADIVLLEKNLGVLIQGVREGRVTFANTLKYVFMATSANFGNMFSMAGASLFLSFLPLLPKQILLTNLVTDFPEMNIATDNVDRELLDKPRRWDIRFIRKFMIHFGLLSSAFDYLTFAILLLWLHATPEQFRTGWFVESVLSASLIVLVIRTRHPFFLSRPGKALFGSTMAVFLLVLGLPYSFLAPVFGFTSLPFSFYPTLGLILTAYIFSAELLKKVFFRANNI